MLTAQQKSDRVNYIGASEAAAVLGLSRWGTPLSVWAEKTGQIVRPEMSTLSQKLGHKLEQTVAELFMEETGKKVQRVNETLFHPVHKFLACNLDRRVVGERSILQCKTASAWKAKEWDGEEIPREYIIQEMHELAVSGMDRAYIAVLIGNQDFKMKIVERSEVSAAIEDMVSREVSFWNDFIVPRVMPTYITFRDRDTLEDLFPIAEPGEPVELDDRANSISESLESMNEDLKALERDIEKQQNELRAMLGHHESGTTGIWDIFWANTIVRRLDGESLKKDHPDLYNQYRKPTTNRRFLIRKTSTQEEDNGNGNRR